MYMSSSGSLILFLAIALLAFAGMAVFSDFDTELSASNDTSVVAKNDMTQSVLNPIITVLGYGAMIVVALAMVSAIQKY
jgi:hypothetical protein